MSYARAERLLRERPIHTLAEIHGCVLRDSPRHVRLVHPGFTLSVRMGVVVGEDESLARAPRLAAPGSVPEERCQAILDALEAAVRQASDDDAGLADLMRAFEVGVPVGQPALRALLPLRVLAGGGRSGERAAPNVKCLSCGVEDHVAAGDGGDPTP